MNIYAHGKADDDEMATPLSLLSCSAISTEIYLQHCLGPLLYIQSLNPDNFSSSQETHPGFLKTHISNEKKTIQKLAGDLTKDYSTGKGTH